MNCILIRILVGVLVAGLVSAAAAEPVPVADFFRPPAVTSPVMSPTGRYVAATLSGGNEGRQRLVILNLQDISKSKVIAAFSDADIIYVQWINDDRLVFTLTDTQAPGANQRGEGLFAVDREGLQGPRRLIKSRHVRVTEATNIVDRELSVYHEFFSLVHDGSNDVVVAQDVYDNVGDHDKTQLWRLDTVTGRVRLLTADAPLHARRWAVDRQGVPRVVASSHGGKTRLYWKPSVDAAWALVLETDTYGDEGIGLHPWVVAGDDVLYGDTLYGDDTGALVRVDMHKMKLEPQALVSLKGYDFTGSLVFGAKGELRGVRYLTDARGTQWFDPALKKIQGHVDALLPGTINMIDCGLCEQAGVVLVSSWSDRQPTVFRLYDVKTGALDVLAAERPWIRPQAMAPRDMVRFAARDGMSIPVHITRPVGQRGPAPAVVLVHGGPWLRGGEWRWDAESQFLASRGYVVVEPEFRGSTGFGFKHYRAGWKQWGLAMQDDVADATEWAIKQGYADPKRVCIAGASYGGYAALMGLVRYPALYRCGVEWVGVTDIGLMYDITWSDFSQMWKQYGMPVLVGDQKADAGQLAQTSPLNRADRITQPLLMAYGGIDRRVPIDHGVKLRDAVRRHNSNLEWVAYADEGHGWMLPANQVDFWSRVERFLDRNLKNAP
jgi:dipeptidyl aminopeptidase/acylaminoacyl peptidase